MPFLEKGLVVRHIRLSRDLFELELTVPKLAAECEPGQFVHVKVGVEDSPLLRRPLSLYDVDREQGRIILLYKVVGRGTGLLSRVPVGDYVDIMGPLGRGFTLPGPECNALLVGGGVGIAPLIFLARVLKSRNCRVKVLHGTRTGDELVAAERLEQIGAEYMTATMDGSNGFKGLVTELLNSEIDPQWAQFLYTCGPEPMMAVVAGYARDHNLPGQVSLEEHMACGVGACLGCARQTRADEQKYIKVCKDGPVFDVNDVFWSRGGKTIG